jgi:hypothetical protein
MKNIFIALAILLIIPGCNVEQKVSQFEGDGTITFAKRPGLLGSDGVILAFDTFTVSSNFNQTYSFNKLPQLDNSYRLYLTVQSPRPIDALKPCIVTSQLIDSRGITIWDVSDKIDSWNCAESAGSSTVDYYLLNTTHTKSLKLNPASGDKYRLTVSFQTSPSCSNLNTKASFRLKAGGYK